MAIPVAVYHTRGKDKPTIFVGVYNLYGEPEVERLQKILPDYSCVLSRLSSMRISSVGNVMEDVLAKHRKER